MLRQPHSSIAAEKPDSIDADASDAVVEKYIQLGGDKFLSDEPILTKPPINGTYIPRIELVASLLYCENRY